MNFNACWTGITIKPKNNQANNMCYGTIFKLLFVFG